MKREVQLYIQDTRVDLFQDETISVTDSIQNVSDISKVFTPFSKQFNLPASSTNNKLFKHYYNFDIQDGFDAVMAWPNLPQYLPCLTLHCAVCTDRHAIHITAIDKRINQITGICDVGRPAIVWRQGSDNTSSGFDRYPIGLVLIGNRAALLVGFSIPRNACGHVLWLGTSAASDDVANSDLHIELNSHTRYSSPGYIASLSHRSAVAVSGAPTSSTASMLALWACISR